jgi:hypothetical protein
MWKLYYNEINFIEHVTSWETYSCLDSKVPFNGRFITVLTRTRPWSMSRSILIAVAKLVPTFADRGCRPCRCNCTDRNLNSILVRALRVLVRNLIIVTSGEELKFWNIPSLHELRFLKCTALVRLTQN